MKSNYILHTNKPNFRVDSISSEYNYMKHLRFTKKGLNYLTYLIKYKLSLHQVIILIYFSTFLELKIMKIYQNYLMMKAY